jgi:hypothetical protein
MTRLGLVASLPSALRFASHFFFRLRAARQRRVRGGGEAEVGTGSDGEREYNQDEPGVCRERRGRQPRVASLEHSQARCPLRCTAPHTASSSCPKVRCMPLPVGAAAVQLSKSRRKGPVARSTAPDRGPASRQLRTSQHDGFGAADAACAHSIHRPLVRHARRVPQLGQHGNTPAAPATKPHSQGWPGGSGNVEQCSRASKLKQVERFGWAWVQRQQPGLCGCCTCCGSRWSLDTRLQQGRWEVGQQVRHG